MMRHIRVAFILSLTVVLTATEVLGLTLSDLMNRREANVQALVNATERLFAGRCTDANCVSSTSSNASGCSFSSCGGNALFQRAMQCYRNFGTDASLCGTGCSGLLRSASNSAVTVAAGATNNAEASTFVCSSSSLTPVFEDLYENQNVAGWQYVASNTGVTRSYPAAYQSSSTSCAAPPDTRQANWYVSASTGPKDIVFVCDFSGSMAATDGGPNGMTRLAALKIGVTSLLASLGPDDRFNIVCFSSTVTVLGPGGALLAGTPANILSMQNALNAFAIGGGTIYAGAFSAALSLMQSNTSTGCARIVMFLTDGAPSDTAATINASIATGQAGLGVNRARIFTYSLSYAFTPTLLRSVACSNAGMWNQIEDASSPNSPLQQYYRFQAVGIVDGKPQWTAPNTSLHGQGSIVTVSMAYFDRSVTPKVFAGVAAIEVLESELLSVGTLAQITAQTTARNSQCLSYDLTECQMQKLRNEANFVCPSPAPALTACTSTNVTVPVCTSGGTDVTNISQVMCNSSAMPNMTEMTCCPLNRCPTSLSRESASTSVTSSDRSTPTNTLSPTASLSPPTFTTTAVPTTSNTTSMTQSPSIASVSPGSTETKLSSATRHSLTVSESAPTMSIAELSLSMTSSHTLHSTDSISFRHLSVSATVSPSPPTSSRTPTTSLVTASTRMPSVTQTLSTTVSLQRRSDTASLSVPPTKSPRSSHSGTVPPTQTIADVLPSASRSMLHSQSASLSHSPSTSSTPSSALSMTLAGPDSLSNTIARESLSSALPNSDSHSVQLSTSLIRTATRVSLTLEHTASAGASGSISNSSNVSRKSSASASRTVSISPFASASPKSLSKTVSRNRMSLSLSNSQTSSIRVSPSLIASMTRQTPPLERTASISATGTGSISSSSNITSQSSSCNQSAAFSFSATVSRSVSVSSTHSIGSASPTPTATSSRDDVTPSLSTTPSASKSASPTPSQSPDSRSDSHSKGSQSGSASVTSMSSSSTVDSRRATANRTAALLPLSPTMVSVAATAADTTDSYGTDLRTFTADLWHSTTLSATPPASMSATKPLFINVTGDLFDSIVDELIPPGRKNETTLTVVAAHVGVVATRRAYFSISKVIALKANGGVVSVMLRLLPQLTMRFSLTGQRIALGTEGLTATVVNQTILLLSMRVTGSQYLATVANINIPLVNLLAGNVRVTGRTELPIQFVLTATTVTALTVTTSIASVTGPISAVAGTTPASAMAVLRLSILIDILQCGFGGDDGGANLFSLAIGPSPGASLRGAVVGNLVFIAAFAALLGILILAFSAYGWVTLNAPLGAMLPDLLNIFHFPGIVLIPVSAVCQPTLTAAVQLIASPPLHGDVTFGVLGAVALLLLLMLPYTIVIATQFCLKLVEENVSEAHQQRGARLSSLMRRFVSMLFSERATWQPIDPARRDHVAWKKRFAPVFIDCSVWWYPLVDLWSGAAVGVVGGLTLGNKSVCLFQLAVVAFSYAIIALLQLVVAPPLVFVSRCYVVVLQVLGLISCGAVLAATVTNDSEDSTSVAVASVSMLLIAVLSTVKSALDVLFLLLAIPGRIRRAAGVGALHGVPTLSSPCGSFHWRSSDVELVLDDAIKVDDLTVVSVGPMMFEGDEMEVHHNPIGKYEFETSEEPQRGHISMRKKRTAFRRSNNVNKVVKHDHYVAESTRSLAEGTQHNDNVVVMSQKSSVSSLHRMASNDHIVVKITAATISDASDISQIGATRKGSTLDHIQSKPSHPSSVARHASTRFDDSFVDSDTPIVSEIRDTSSSFSNRPLDPSENAQKRNGAIDFDGAVSPGILPIKSSALEIPTPVIDDDDNPFGGYDNTSNSIQHHHVDSIVLDDMDRSHITKRAAMMLKVTSMRTPRRDGFSDHASTVEELQLLYRTDGDAT